MTAASTEVAATPWIEADWPAPPGVRAFTTLRYGAGQSPPPFDTFNLGNRYAADGDDPAVVERNRAELIERAALPSAPHWLKQVHGTDVLRFDASAAEDAAAQEPIADAAATSTPGVVLAILTADCLPVVFAADDGREIAAAHAGWPGLSAGMLEATVAAMRTPAERLLAWIGPCAGPARYEIGVEVRERFLAWGEAAEAAFVATRPGHWLVDLPAIARMRLARVGVHRVYGGDICTMSDPERYFSHRRSASAESGRTGRMATLAWFE